MLHLDPQRRPKLSEILAQPICQRGLADIYTRLGAIPCLSASRLSLSASQPSRLVRETSFSVV